MMIVYRVYQVGYKKHCFQAITESMANVYCEEAMNKSGMAYEVKKTKVKDLNKILKKIQTFLTRGNSGPDIDEWCKEIYEAIQEGSFTPFFESYPLAFEYYKRFLHEYKKRKF